MRHRYQVAQRRCALLGRSSSSGPNRKHARSSCIRNESCKERPDDTVHLSVERQHQQIFPFRPLLYWNGFKIATRHSGREHLSGGIDGNRSIW
jgi:hypothetical protein